MPTHRGSDSGGPYYQWGASGKRYHYQVGNKASAARAKAKADKQGRAVKARGGK